MLVNIPDELRTEWEDFCKAFVGAFDTPVDRRHFAKEPADIYAQDAVRRFRTLREKMNIAFHAKEETT